MLHDNTPKHHGRRAGQDKGIPLLSYVDISSELNYWTMVIQIFPRTGYTSVVFKQNPV